MKNPVTMLPLLALVLILVGCDEKQAKDKATEVFREYFQLRLTSEAGGRDLSVPECRDLAARRNGFQSWDDFMGMGLRFLGAEAWTELEGETHDEFVAKRLALRWQDEGVKAIDAGEVEMWQGGDEDEEDTLPPVFKEGAKLGDPVVKEYYEIKEVRGDWIRADHYKVRGSVIDLLAKGAWVFVPTKGWDWVEYPWK